MLGRLRPGRQGSLRRRSCTWRPDRPGRPRRDHRDASQGAGIPRAWRPGVGRDRPPCVLRWAILRRAARGTPRL